VVQTLVKCATDKTKMIFNTNICKVCLNNLLEIIATMLHRWRKIVALDKNVVALMIGSDESKPDSQFWKMTGIQILALAVQFGIPLLESSQSVTSI